MHRIVFEFLISQRASVEFPSYRNGCGELIDDCFIARSDRTYAPNSGFLFTYIAPLALVLSITLVKEAYEDFKRYLRDKEANGQMYDRHCISDIVAFACCAFSISITVSQTTSRTDVSWFS